MNLYNPKIFDFRGNSPTMVLTIASILNHYGLGVKFSLTLFVCFFEILDLKHNNPKIFTDSNDVVTSFMASLTAMDWG